MIVALVVFYRNNDTLISQVDNNQLTASLVTAKEEWTVRNISYSPLSEKSTVSEWQQCAKNSLQSYPQYPKLVARDTKLANLLVKRKILIEKAGNAQENVSLVDGSIDLIGKTLENGKNVNSFDGLSGALMLPFPTPQNIKFEGAVLDSKCVYEKERDGFNKQIENIDKQINSLMNTTGDSVPTLQTS